MSSNWHTMFLQVLNFGISNCLFKNLMKMSSPWWTSKSSWRRTTSISRATDSVILTQSAAPAPVQSSRKVHHSFHHQQNMINVSLRNLYIWLGSFRDNSAVPKWLFIFPLFSKTTKIFLRHNFKSTKYSYRHTHVSVRLAVNQKVSISSKEIEVSILNS